jgi:hypothetical protein
VVKMSWDKGLKMCKESGERVANIIGVVPVEDVQREVEGSMLKGGGES